MTGLDLAERYGETTLTNLEVYGIGSAVVRTLGAVCRLGHSSPASLLDYLTDPGVLDTSALIVRDLVAWTAGRGDLVPGCEDRLRGLVAAADVDSELATSVGLRLTERRSA